MLLTNKILVDHRTCMLIEEFGLQYNKAKSLFLMHGSVKKVVDASCQQSDKDRIP